MSSAEAAVRAAPWWSDRGLSPTGAGLEFGGRSVVDVAKETGTPMYLYSGEMVQRRIAEIRRHLESAAADFRIYYAMKANRYAPLIDIIRSAGDIGIDACSPREVDLALRAGFSARDISFTASMLSDRDLAALAQAGVHLNLDCLSAIRRYAPMVPRGTRIGLRVDPGLDTGYAAKSRLSYGNAKLGFETSAVAEAVDAARSFGLSVDTLHMHLGWGLQEKDLPNVRRAFECLASAIPAIPDLRVLNIGGGLGARNRAADRPLDPAEWASAIRDILGPSRLTIACEPGTFIAADAGILVVEVNTVMEKNGGTWIGVDAGHNINVYPCHYGIPLEIVHVGRPFDTDVRPYTVVGNINEAGDVFARGCLLPEVREGDFLAMLPAGAYGSSMSSDHCLRGHPREYLIPPRKA